MDQLFKRIPESFSKTKTEVVWFQNNSGFRNQTEKKPCLHFGIKPKLYVLQKQSLIPLNLQGVYELTITYTS